MCKFKISDGASASASDGASDVKKLGTDLVVQVAPIWAERLGHVVRTVQLAKVVRLRVALLAAQVANLKRWTRLIGTFCGLLRGAPHAH